MSQKIEKPSLTGHRIKARKRDEKEKYDPSSFRDSIVQGLNKADKEVEQISKFLDCAGGSLDYRRYSEALFDILFAGGILAPGGSLQLEGGNVEVFNFSVFTAKPQSIETFKSHYQIFYKLIRRYKYLEKSFEDEIKKLILFLKGFSIDERSRLGIVVGVCLANSLVSPNIISTLFDQHLVKDGLSIEFAVILFGAWLGEKDVASICASLKRCGLESRLLHLLPINKQSQQHFDQYFNTPTLQPIAELQKTKANAEMKKCLASKLEEMIQQEETINQMITFVKEHMTAANMLDHEAIIMIWGSIMGSVEWNKKEDLVGEQAVRHLKAFAPLFRCVCDGSEKAQLALLNRMQEYCYDNMHFTKAFSKIAILFYKNDVLGEDSVLAWFTHAHLQKGKSIFLEQLTPFIHWLQNAEEESDDNAD